MKGLIKRRYIALIALAVLVLLVVSFLFQAVIVYNSQVIAKEKGSPVGIAPFEDRIDFGDIPQGSAVGKTLILENNGTVASQISVFIIGNIGDLVRIQPSSATLKPGEKIEIKFQLTMPASATPERLYTGKVVVLRMPKSLW